jgi:hypothetical protein
MYRRIHEDRQSSMEGNDEKEPVDGGNVGGEQVMSLTRKAGGILAVLSLLLVSLVATAPSSSAGDHCVPPLCSRIVNDSPYWIVIARNWCGDEEYLVRNDPPCGAGQEVTLNAGDSTPVAVNEDWDTFRVDAGFCYIWTIWRLDLSSDSWYWDLTGSDTHAWVRVHNDERATIQAQDCGLSAAAGALRNGKPQPRALSDAKGEAGAPVLLKSSPARK